ncbi:hypothetical protein ON010_g9251 [Phytophthora cinnamomi]|nr:hypothetical protein ON010_g9251 [Phytophthora cinnamomi]
MPTDLRVKPVFARLANLRCNIDKKNKCDKKAKMAQQEARKTASRLSDRVHYLKLECTGRLAVGDAVEEAWEDSAAALTTAKELATVNFAGMIDLR